MSHAFFYRLITKSSHRYAVQAGIATLVVTPVVAVMQGSLFLAEYRMNHMDAPAPISPSRGVVVVSPRDLEKASATSGLARSLTVRKIVGKNKQNESGDTPIFENVRTMLKQRNNSKSDEDHILDAANTTPLRLLVIGDSLAAGIGTARSGTPVLPESIARALSKALGGRAVYWTCHGSPGASTSQIVRDIESFHEEGEAPSGARRLPNTVTEVQGAAKRAKVWFQERRRKKLSLRGETNVDDTDNAAEQSVTIGVPSSKGKFPDGKRPGRFWRELRRDLEDLVDTIMLAKDADGTINVEDEGEQRAWRRWHAKHRDGVDGTESQGQYDIAVVLTGLNDLKRSVIPFMMSEDPVQNKSNLNGKGKGGFKDQLKGVLDALGGKMRLMEHRRRRTTRQLDGQRRRTKEPMLESLKNPSSERRRPLVVFPALLPAIVPVFQYPPLSWFAVPLIDQLDMDKKAISQDYPGKVLYVEAPTIAAIAEIEAGTGPLWAKRRTEDVLLALTDVRHRARAKVESLMDNYYKKMQKHNPTKMVLDREEDEKQAQAERQFEQAYYHHQLTEIPNFPGAKLVSADNVHPNDEGYEFWGRHIAAAIVREWRE